MHIHRRVLLDSHHGLLVVGLVSLWREDRSRTLRDNLGLLRLDEVDMDGLLLVCGKKHVLLMLIIMTLVESKMVLDLDSQKREQYD